MFTLDELLVNPDSTFVKDRKRRKELESIILSPVKAKTELRVRLRVTPSLAKYWMENYNTHNRLLIECRYTTIAVDILDKRWQYNADPIRFGSNGQLLDGQHRLMACIECDMAIDTLVVFGLLPSTQDVIDINRPRSAGDMAHLHDISNANEACAIENMLLMHERFGINKQPAGFASVEKERGKIRIKWSRPTKTEIVRSVQIRSHLQERISEIRPWRQGRLLPPRIIGFCHYLFSEQDHALSVKFFEECILAENLKSSTPTHWMHTRLVENRSAKHRLLHVELIALIFKAWIAYRDKESIRFLRWSRGQGEEFPDITQKV